MAQGILVRDPKKLHQNYMLKATFKIDCLSILPLDLFYFVRGIIEYGCTEAAALASAASPLGGKKHYRNPLPFPKFFTSVFLGCYGFAHLPLECVSVLSSLKTDWIWFGRLGIPETHKTGLRFSGATVPLQLLLVIKNAYNWRN